MEETIIPACDVFRPEIEIKNTPIELCWNFATVKKNIKFGVYKNLETSSPAEKHLSISYPPIEKTTKITSNDKLEVASSVDSSSDSLSYGRRKSNFNDYNLEMIKQLNYYDSSKSLIKGSCIINEPGKYVLVFDNSINRNTANRLLFVYYLKSYNPSPNVERETNNQKAKENILFEDYISKKKRNSKINGWVKRYVKIDNDGNLSYYKNSRDSKSRGLIQIISSKVNIISKRRIYIDTGAFIYRFYIRDDKVYQRFINALEIIEKSNSKGQFMASIRNILYNKKEFVSSNNLVELQKGFDEPLIQIHKELNNLGNSINSYKKKYDIKNIEMDYENIMKNMTEIDIGLNQIWKKINQEEICVQKLEKTFGNCLIDNNRLRNIVHEPQVDISYFTTSDSQEIINTPLIKRESLKIKDRSMTVSTKGDDECFYDAEEGFSISEDDETSTESDDFEEDDDEDDENSNGSEIFNPSLDKYDVLIKRNNTNTKPAAEKNISQNIVRRTTLPAKTHQASGSMISILKKNIGKDLTRISMPVTFNEPINLLQRLCEELEYTELIKNACDETISKTPFERLMYIGAFATSIYAGSVHRAVKKPFNPLLGETYENIREDKGFKFIAEKVSHHPAIMACYAESDDFIFFQDSYIKTKYWGNSMECVPYGTVHLILKKFNEHYIWDKVTSVICNAMYNNRYIENRGELKVTETSSGNYCSIKFKESSLFNSSKNEISGGVYSKNKTKEIGLLGTWNKVLFKVEKGNTLESIWTANPFPPNVEDQYGFGQFTVELNEITPDIEDLLPPTDTRFRPDQRLYENGQVDEASKEKERVEQAQREYLKDRETKGLNWEPRWFELKTDPIITTKKSYQYKGGYFENRGNIKVDHQLW